MKPINETLRVALATAIATNADARACANRLAGKTIALECLDHRAIIRFEDGEAHVESEPADADVTVRGSPAAMASALLGSDRETAAVFGDVDVFEDFRQSFRPHLALPNAFDHLAEDAGDAARLAARAAQSAFEGLLAGLRPEAPAASAEQSEVEELRSRVGKLESRLAALEAEARATASGPGEPR